MGRFRESWMTIIARSHGFTRRALPLALAVLCPPAIATAAPAQLPDRLIQCSLGRVLNFDPRKQQTMPDLVYEGRHRFALFLPAVPVRTAPPPDAIEKAEPVNPRTRIIVDPDNIAAQATTRFNRVVDYWPERVELAGAVQGTMVNAIVIAPIDAASGTAQIFMTHADELTHWDVAHIYQGTCTILKDASARKTINQLNIPHSRKTR